MEYYVLVKIINSNHNDNLLLWNLVMLNPTWLNTLVTLVDMGHFKKTAKKLFLTQPGVSQHISKLEKACGHSLIRREKKELRSH